LNLTYVLITAARNEEAFIEKTIQSVLSQTILPKKWVIVSDGSTDRTDEIIQNYATGRDWVDFLRMPERKERHFAGKAYGFNTGYARMKTMNYDVIGNVDADISFERDYFEYLLDKFQKYPDLGVAGTHYVEGRFHSFRDSYIDMHHVNGQCQLFRRCCFEEIGGYLPIRAGGIDWIAVTTARMNGWKTYSFAERTFIHHRGMGTAGSNVLKARFHYGKKDYLFGGHPLWEVLRGVFQMTKRPYLVGGLCLLSGYFWSVLTRAERPISRELITFHRNEQMKRLKTLFHHGLGLNR
jgi:biofilm PGA synthesis N-glycosyltransferase PgaC